MPKNDLPQIIIPYSFSDRFVMVVAKFFYLALIFSVLISVGYVLWIGWAFSIQLRVLLDSVWWSILIYLIVTIFVFFLGYLLAKLQLLIMGGASFGKLGGLPLSTMSASIRASAQITVDLFDHDKPLAERFNIIQVRVLHDTLQAKYKDHCHQLGRDIADLETEWDKIWNRQVLDMSFAGQSLRDALDTNKFGTNYAITALMRSTYVFPVVVNIFWILIVFLIYSYANGDLTLLTCVQIGMLMIFVMASFWYLYVLHNLTVFPLTFSGTSIPSTTREEFSKDIDELEGMEIRPKHLQVKEEFYHIIRSYQTRLLCSSIISDTSILLLIIGLIYGLIVLVNADYAHMVSHYHAVLAYGVIIAAIGIVFTFYIFSVILQHFRKITAALIVALLSSGLPFLIDYLLGGEINIIGVREAIFAGSGGLTVALITAITSNVKKSIE